MKALVSTVACGSASIAAQRVGNCGRVFAVVAMSSISTPGTAKPMIAPAVAMRWSS